MQVLESFEAYSSEWSKIGSKDQQALGNWKKLHYQNCHSIASSEVLTSKIQLIVEACLFRYTTMRET